MPAAPQPYPAQTDQSGSEVDATPTLLAVVEALARQAARRAWREGELKKPASAPSKVSSSHAEPTA